MLEVVAVGLPVRAAGDTPLERLRTRLLAAHAHLTRHVWVVRVLAEGEMVARGALPFDEACLADFAAAGLGVEEASWAFLSCWQSIVGDILDAHSTGPGVDTQRRLVAQAAVPDELPHFVAALPHFIARREDPERRVTAFAWSLDRALRGLLGDVSAPDRPGRQAAGRTAPA
nr:TetR/AcrR family transcriptional regulator C-terminal domain-containing protein [Streptomyces sp. SID3343]